MPRGKERYVVVCHASHRDSKVVGVFHEYTRATEAADILRRKGWEVRVLPILTTGEVPKAHA